MEIKIKTTEQIITENQEIVENIMNQKERVELYNGEFDETYLKKWVAVDDIINYIDEAPTNTDTLHELYKLLKKQEA